MAVGLERFSELTRHPGVEEQRVQVNRQTGQMTLRAPTSLWGRFVDWVQGNDHTQARLQEYRSSRTAFHEALVKSYGEEFANKVLDRTVGLEGTDFKKHQGSLQVSEVRQVLAEAQRLSNRYVMQTWGNTDRFIAEGGLGDLDVPDDAPNLRDDPELRRTFHDLVRTHPEFGRKALSDEVFRDLAQQALDKCLEGRQARFDEQYPELAQLDNGHFHDIGSYFSNLMGDLYSVSSPLYDLLSDDQKLLGGETIDSIRKSSEHLATMRFDPGEAQRQMREISGHISELQEQYEAIGTALRNGEIPDEARPMFEALANEISNQVDRLQAKLEVIDEYLQADPLSDKAVAYDKLIWRQATVVALEDVLARLKERSDRLDDGPERDKLDRHIDKVETELDVARVRVGEARQEWQDAPLDRTTDPGTTIFSHKLKQSRQEEQRFLDESLERSKVIVTRGSDKLLQQSRTKALDTVQEWKPIDRHMTVTRDGVTRTYRSLITPGSQLEGVVGQSYQDDGLGGVSAGNKNQPGHARNLQVSELYRTEPDGSETRISQTIRHGVLDPWDIEDPALRRRAQDKGAREVVQTVLDVNPEFTTRAIEKRDQGDPPSKLVHVNFNLTTADDSILRKFSKDYRESDFTFNQFRAFDEMQGTQQMRVDPNDEEDTVPIDVETITFSFGVNKVAMGEGIFALSGEDTLWGLVEEHDRQNLVKLIGDLTFGTAPGGHIGAMVDRLKEEAESDQTTPERRQELEELIGKIQKEVDVCRNLFNSGAFKRDIDDAYKMVRHVMRVVNLGQEALQTLDDDDMLMSMSQGCKSNKDRGGMGDVEHKAQLMIEDMGGRVLPNQEFSEQDQRIYDTVLTSSGQVEVQQYNTGLGGSKNVGELQNRIGDEDAYRYAKGFSSWTKA
jgi:phosphatidylinositol-4,5-bisphosphate 4-phosphatase